jgi:phenylpyruvate tautomerase PptA (4-oxalocrotonate tautomerase family)
MPTYVCSIAPNTLTDEQKMQIATAISNRHSEATGAHPFFVQVEIDENPRRTRYLGGSPANAHIWIRGDIRGGRSDDARQRLMLSIMRDVASITGLKEQDIWIYLCNLAPIDMVEYGHVLPPPGSEKVWFENLPADLKTYLMQLGVQQHYFDL